MNKTFLFPGWMSRVKNYHLGAGAEIWQEPTDPFAPLRAKYLIGHSLGANFALLNWQGNKKAKLILVSPIIFKKPLIVWFYRWLKYFIKEGLIITSRDLKSNRIIFGVKNGYRLLNSDCIKIINEVPRENLLIIRGTKDDYFCDRSAADFIRSKSIRMIEIEGSGHNWNDEFKKTVQAVLTEWQQH